MTTLSVTIDDTNKLQMLLDWLRSISFVKLCTKVTLFTQLGKHLGIKKAELHAISAMQAEGCQAEQGAIEAANRDVDENDL